MKILGLVGGISWVSTLDYYRFINEGINEKLGGLNFAQCIIYSLNFDDFQRSNTANNWEATFVLIAIKDSGFDMNAMAPFDVGVIWGTGQGGMETFEGQVTVSLLLAGIS